MKQYSRTSNKQNSPAVIQSKPDNKKTLESKISKLQEMLDEHSKELAKCRREITRLKNDIGELTNKIYRG